MKHLILPIITLFFLGSVIAQTEYESPHVKEGKTIQFTIPEGFYELSDISSSTNVMYSSVEDEDFELMDLKSMKVGLISVSHKFGENQTLESLMRDLNSEIKPEIVILGKPEITKINGLSCMLAGFKGNLVDDEIDRMYFCVIEFGDYFILVNYLSSFELEDHLEYSEFENMMSSLKEISTTKEDGMEDFEEYNYEEYDPEMYEEYESNYTNDFFETEISEMDVLPDLGDHWDLPLDENSNLLCEFVYKENNGTIKVFSGGAFTNYPSEKEKAEAIQLVMELSSRVGLKKDSEFSNEDHAFQLYTISGGGTMTSVYTTTVNKELVFFVVDGGSNSVPDFKPAVRDLMLTMWVDSYDYEEEEE